MPADLNRVTLVGRLTRDPELRHTAGGETAVCSLRLAVNARARDEEGSWTDRPNYLDVTLFGRQAEAASAHLANGRRIGVDGRLAWREWTAGDGSRRESVAVVAGEVQFLDSSRNGAPTTTNAEGKGGGDDDIPF